VVAVVAVVGEGTVEAAEEDVDSEFIRKCKWYLISQILLDQNTVPWVEGWHGCIAA
jgi:chorismate-pyruvate lyase